MFSSILPFVWYRRQFILILGINVWIEINKELILQIIYCIWSFSLLEYQVLYSSTYFPYLNITCFWLHYLILGLIYGFLDLFKTIDNNILLKLALWTDSFALFFNLKNKHGVLLWFPCEIFIISPFLLLQSLQRCISPLRQWWNS